MKNEKESILYWLLVNNYIEALRVSIMGKTQISLPGVAVKKLLDGKNVLFSFTFGVGSPANPLFFTSPALRKSMKELKVKTGEELGFISYSKTKRGEFGEWIYPIKQYEKALERLGIARGLERIATRELRKHVGKNVKIFPAVFAVPARAFQLQKMGIPTTHIVGGIYDYEFSLDTLRRKINEARRKYRIANRKKVTLPQPPQLKRKMLKRRSGK